MPLFFLIACTLPSDKEKEMQELIDQRLAEADKVESETPEIAPREQKLRRYDSLVTLYEGVAYGDIMFGMTKAQVKRCAEWKGGWVEIGKFKYKLNTQFDSNGELYEVALFNYFYDNLDHSLLEPAANLLAPLDEKYLEFRIDWNEMPNSESDVVGQYNLRQYVIGTKEINLYMGSGQGDIAKGTYCVFHSILKRALHREGLLKGRELARKQHADREAKKVKSSAQGL